MSCLKINRLLVTKSGALVYNELFHSGVNIIRGDNSTGKSTISNFIFYVLGGDFNDWLPEAKECDYVYAEISISNRTICVGREIDDSSQRPMIIFNGTYEESLTVSISEWKKYNYKRTNNSISFSQVLFNMLDFPEISTANQENITINQVLRLMYIDQLSSLNGLMRNVDFDSPLVREAIGHLLLGTYNDQLLELQKNLRQSKKEKEKLSSEINAIKSVLNDSQLIYEEATLNRDIDRKRKELDKVVSTLSDPESLLRTVKRNETRDRLKELNKNVTNSKNSYSKLLNAIQKLEISVLDDNDFADNLEIKTIAIDNSIKSRVALGGFDIKYCPICLEKIEICEDHHCRLCKKEIEDEKNFIGEANLLRMRQEIKMQISESKKIIHTKLQKLHQLRNNIKFVEKELQQTQSDYDIYLGQISASRETKFEKLYERKAALFAEISMLEKQLELVKFYNDRVSDKALIEKDLVDLQSNIDRVKASNSRKKALARIEIQKYTLDLLKMDGGYEDDNFKHASNVKLDFYKNLFYLDNRNKYSASSLVVLKNSIRFAMFFASLKLNFFRYPRFILCDNIEDKGMNDIRSKEFQKSIVALADSEGFRDMDYQIIITTSMIDKSLDIPKYTIGDYYTKKNKSLKV